MEKSSAQVSVPDGAGGMTPVRDLRFEAGDWPIAFDIAAEAADAWTACLASESSARNWNFSAFSESEIQQNSGTITVMMGADPKSPKAEIVWSRSRTGPLVVRARSTDDGQSLLQVREFLDLTKEKATKSLTSLFHSRGVLYYEGLPWLGELWLEDGLRLGPPSRQYDQALLGPRVILVDAMVPAFGRTDAGSRLHLRLRELSAFLSVVMRCRVRT